MRALNRTVTLAKQLPERERVALIEELESALQPATSPEQRTPMLTWTQVRRMQGEGIRFGSHTVSHAILSRVDSARAARELYESKAELEEQLGVPASCFAYPNGRTADFTPEVVELVKRAGYTCAVTTERGYNTALQNPLLLRREQPWQTEPESFRMHLFLQHRGWTR